jgi:hypothetical protein
MDMLIFLIALYLVGAGLGYIGRKIFYASVGANVRRADKAFRESREK